MYCENQCHEAAVFEKQDNSKNYSKEKYIQKPTNVTGYKALGWMHD